MKKELEDKIFNEFPEFFTNKKDIRNSAMGFGFECRDGWFDLVYNLCKRIHTFYTTKYIGHGPDKEIYHHVVPPYFEVLQVKEKWGSLRFYITGAPMEVHDMIHEAEHQSFYICEICGKRAEKSFSKDYKSFYRDELPWVQTLCDDCLKEVLDEMGLPFKDYVSDWQKEHNAPYIEG
jgi:hypothetical protein